jgi:hypothetical protein
MSSSAPSFSSLRELLAELEHLLRKEVETRACDAGRVLTEHLNQSVRRLRQAAGLREIAAILCEASAQFCNACGFFRVTEDVVAGECARGLEGEAAARFRDVNFAARDAAAFAGAMDSREPVAALCSPAEIPPAVIALFRQAPDDKAYLFPLTVQQTALGILYAVGAVESAGLELLTQSAAAILEARQRAVRAPAPDLVRIEPGLQGPTPDSRKSAAPDWQSLSPDDRKLHLSAQRFARVQVAEMRLYRTDAVKAGRARGDLYSVLQDAIDGGREAFRQAFLSATPSMVDYFHQELVRTLANQNPAWLGEKYPGPLV